jgi:hypothetical protein
MRRVEDTADEKAHLFRCATEGKALVTVHQALVATYDNPMIAVDSADFDAANDYLSVASLTGIADSNKGIFSGWFRLDGGDASALAILSGFTSPVNESIQIYRNASNKFSVSLLASGSPGSQRVLLMSNTSYVAGATWYHFLASWNGDTTTGHLFVNDADDLNTVTDVVSASTSDLTCANGYAIGVSSANLTAYKFNGCMAEVYFAPGQYLDFSLVYNRRKFISASGKPVHLGTTGALPTGTAPIVYQHLDDSEAVANFATNRGTGGNFSITGTLDTGSTSPSD